MDNETKYLIRKLKQQIGLCCGLMMLVISAVFLFHFDVFPREQKTVIVVESLDFLYDSKYDITLLSDSEENTDIKYGYELFVNTPKYIGPDNDNPEKGYSGNRLACNNCHLYSGTKPFSAPLVGVINRFPQFRGRENKMGTIEERINGCMERSMNGRTMPPNGKEMKAFVNYLTWLSRFAPEDGKMEGLGFVKIEIPDRKVNLENGMRVFNTICIVCHRMDGEGEKNPDGLTYKYPPLWGDDSYNNGAGMTRVITAAQFIKANMPFGVISTEPLLTDEEAYDVAGYINQQERPTKANRDRDFPDINKKPVSTPYPPYADSFSIDQHQLGPFQPIMEFYKQEYNIVKTK